MKKISKIALTAFAVTNAVALNAMPVSASYGSTPPPVDCLSIDQTVSNPAVTKTIEYVDNISPSDVKYQPNTTVVARIKVKNTSNTVIPNVKVSNAIPDYVSYFAGPGSLSDDKKTLVIDNGDLQAGEEKYYYVTYKTARAEDLPADKSIVCVINKVAAQGSICNRDEDSAQLCIEKQVLGKGITPSYTEKLQSVKTAPKAGPEMGIALLGLNGVLGTVGYILKKKIGA